MGAFVQSLGPLAQSAGEAFTQQRAFDLAQQKAQAEIALQNAQATEALQRGKQLEQYGQRDRWAPVGNAPVLNTQTGQWEYILRDQYSGGIQRIPAGAPANSIQAMLQQMGNAGGQSGNPDSPAAKLINDPRFMEQFVANKLGVKNPWLGMTKQWRQVGDQMYMGYVDPRTQQWTPIYDQQQQPISQGVPQAWQQTLGPGNTPTLTAVPTRTNVGGQVPPAAKGAARTNNTPPPATSGGGRSLTPANALKDVPADVSTELRYLNKVDDLIQRITPTLEPFKDNNSLLDRFSSAIHSGTYSAGFKDAWSQINQLESLMNSLAGSAFMKGRPAYAMIEQIQQHLPKPWMTPAAQYQRMADLVPLVEQWKQIARESAGTKMIGQQIVPPPSMVGPINQQLSTQNPYRTK